MGLPRLLVVPGAPVPTPDESFQGVEPVRLVGVAPPVPGRRFLPELLGGSVHRFHDPQPGVLGHPARDPKRAVGVAPMAQVPGPVYRFDPFGLVEAGRRLEATGLGTQALQVPATGRLDQGFLRPGGGRGRLGDDLGLGLAELTPPEGVGQDRQISQALGRGQGGDRRPDAGAHCLGQPTGCAAVPLLAPGAGIGRPGRAQELAGHSRPLQCHEGVEEAVDLPGRDPGRVEARHQPAHRATVLLEFTQHGTEDARRV